MALQGKYDGFCGFAPKKAAFPFGRSRVKLHGCYSAVCMGMMEVIMTVAMVQKTGSEKGLKLKVS